MEKIQGLDANATHLKVEKLGLECTQPMDRVRSSNSPNVRLRSGAGLDTSPSLHSPLLNAGILTSC